MHLDVVDLRDFYETRLGLVATRLLRQRLREVWPDLTGMRVLGLGFATPFLGPWRGEAERVMAAMPAGQGVLRWPLDGPILTTLTEETDLPFPDVAFDRILMVHSLDSAENVRPLMREAWRVLSPSGRLMVVVPNRRGLWARFERTPFGFGRPYSPGQLARLLRDCMFTPTRVMTALSVPPLRWRLVLSAAPALEKLSGAGFGAFAGVVVAEAEKRIYGAQPMVREKVRRGRGREQEGVFPMPGMPVPGTG